MSEGIHHDAVADEAFVDSSTGTQQAGTFRYFSDGGRWVWSAAAARMHGYRRADVEPSLEILVQYMHFEDRARMVSVLRRVTLGESLRSRYRIVDKAGNLHWIVVVADPMEDESGAAIGASGYFIDVTETVRVGVTAAVADIATSRAVIEQAKGVIIAAYGGSAEDAFTLLVRRSQDTNVKLRDIATQLVDVISGGSANLRRRVDTVLSTVSASR